MPMMSMPIQTTRNNKKEPWICCEKMTMRLPEIKQMAEVLAQKIQQGQYTFEEAIGVSRAVLFDSPGSLLGMIPRVPPGESNVAFARGMKAS